MYLPGDDAEPWSRHQLRIHLHFPRCLTALRSLFWKWAEKHQCRIQVRNHWKLQRFEESRECTLNCWKGSSNQCSYTGQSFLPADVAASSCSSVLLNPGLTQLCFICSEHPEHPHPLPGQRDVFPLPLPPAGGFPWSWVFLPGCSPVREIQSWQWCGEDEIWQSCADWKWSLPSRLGVLVLCLWIYSHCCVLLKTMPPGRVWLQRWNMELQNPLPIAANEGASLTLSVGRLRGCLC